MKFHCNPNMNSLTIFQFKDVIKSNQNRPQRCLMVLWALGQAGISKFSAGLRGRPGFSFYLF